MRTSELHEGPPMAEAMTQAVTGALTRVLAGPVMDRPAAERLQVQVKAELGIDGLVRSHP